MFRERKFRFNLWAVGTLFSVLVVGLTEVLLSFSSSHIPLWRDPAFAIGLLAVLWIVWGILWAFAPVYVGPDGIRATDAAARFHNVKWNEMTKVSNLLTFYWVRHGNWGKALCFPMSLEDVNGFRAYILEHAPEGNPLRAYIERH